MLIPLKVYVPTDRKPWANCGLVALIVVVSLAAFSDRDLFWNLAGIKVNPETKLLDEMGLGYRATLTTENYPLPVLAITSSLLHADLLHLLGNMLFLWLFGNAVNYKFGQLGFLGLYLVSALVGTLAHYGFENLPVVGASGAINGVMGAFLVYFPRNDVTVVWVLWLRPHISTLSSGWIILLWLAWDVLYLAIGVQTNVALWAHVGGFATGFGIATLCALTGWVKSEADEQMLYQLLSRRR